jgi:hypothetical protein
MNIFEKYLELYGQMIILILGLPCTNKSEIAKLLSQDLNVPLIKINDYIIQDNFIQKEFDGVVFKLYEHSDAYDWEKLNTDVNNAKATGVIVYGNYLNKEKIDWDIDFSFFYSMNTSLCRKVLQIKKLLPNETSEEKVKIYFDKVFNPTYDELKTQFKINKFYNIKETTTVKESYDDIFDLLMELIKNKLVKK